MTVLAPPNHPARRAAAIFLAAAGAVSLVAAAVISIVLIIQDQRHGSVSRVAGTAGVPDVHIEARAGLVAATTVETAAEFEVLAGFAPFLPSTLPASTDTTPRFAVAEPDARGVRGGSVLYVAREGWSAYGISGPAIVIGQARGTAGEGVDGQLKRIAGHGRALVVALPCGELVLDVQLYFAPEPAEGEEIITPYMRDVAVRFLDGIRKQCGE
jgi:hypothetical protein